MFLVSRGHHEDVVREKERIIVLLSDEIDWLRAQLGMPSTRPTLNPSELPVAVHGESAYLSEEEEDLHFLRTTDQISDVELSQALAQLAQTQPISFQ